MSSTMKRYFAAAAAHEYAQACALMTAASQRPVAGKPCPQALALSLQHGVYAGVQKNFPELVVTGARVEAPTAKAYALIGKRSAGKADEFIAMRLEGGVWRPQSFAPFPLDTEPLHMYRLR